MNAAVHSGLESREFASLRCPVFLSGTSILSDRLVLAKRQSVHSGRSDALLNVDTEIRGQRGIHKRAFVRAFIKPAQASSGYENSSRSLFACTRMTATYSCTPSCQNLGQRSKACQRVFSTKDSLISDTNVDRAGHEASSMTFVCPVSQQLWCLSVNSSNGKSYPGPLGRLDTHCLTICPFAGLS